jgi:predicted HTH domain antitoxin
MLALTIELPEYLLFQMGSSTEKLQSEIRRMLAVNMFKEGFMTTGQAAEFCGMHRVEFMYYLSKKNIPVVDWDLEDIEKELELVDKI